LSQRPLHIAGATGYGVWPENTLEGAARCLTAPFDGIEIDVQLTADGHVLAHHDYRLNPDQTRLGGGWLEAPSAPLKTMRLEDVRRYDVGRSRPGSAVDQRYPARVHMDGVCVPTLPELPGALRQAARSPAALIYVEIETRPGRPEEAPEPEAVVSAVLRDLDAADWTQHAKIIAFDWRVLRLARERAPELRTAHLTVPRRPEVIASSDRSPSMWADGFDSRDHGGSDLRAVKAHGGVEWSPYYTDVTPERMEEARALGLLVGPWGLSATADIRRMAELGVFSSTVSGAEPP
jgi:glycerophosphoryl diester phosphodiesterase